MKRATLALALALVSAKLALGCGTDIAQTADLRGGSASCEVPPGAVSLPTAPELGGGDRVSPWDLILDSYGPGEGPGLHVAARDAFRVYVNDRLVAESSQARRAEFVPITWLPGTTVISVIVSAADQLPRALIHLDELEESHTSGDGWKVSTRPVGDFKSSGYDDSSFATPRDFGGLGSSNGCDPTSFPPGSNARWIGPEQALAEVAVFRYQLRIAPTGFGSATTGGNGTATVLVTNESQLRAELANDEARVILLPEGVSDLRLTDDELREVDVCPTPCEADTGKTVYTVLLSDAVCDAPLRMKRSERRIGVGSNKTLVGLGRGAQLRGVSFELGSSRNVIFRNLAIYDVNPGMIEAGDGIGLIQPSRVWIDHCTFRWISDGYVDARPGSREVTVSWSHFDGRNDLACNGRHPRASQVSGATVSFDHVYWDHVHGRSPLVDRELSLSHVLNNFIDDDTDYAIGSACGAQVLVEGTSFRNTRFPTSKLDCPDALGVLGSIRAPRGSNRYALDVGPHRSAGLDAIEPEDDVFVPPYPYTIEPAESSSIRVPVRAGAGSIWRLPLALD